MFARTPSSPTSTGASRVLRGGGHDGVVALGGGSPLDVGKAIGLMAGQIESLLAFEDIGDAWTRVDTAAMVPVIAIPTTAGTGSEVGRASVVTDGGRKRIIFHPDLTPDQVICDPILTVGLPPHLTAATGMDALSHCLEAYCASGFHPLADGVALQGMALVHQHLAAAVADGADLVARSGMLAASLMGATAFQKGLGAMHALSHSLGAIYDLHHGLLNAVVMPTVLRHNRAGIEDRIVRVSAYLGLPPSFDAFLDWILALRTSLEIPDTLSALEIGQSDLDRLVELAMGDAAGAGNPLPLDPVSIRRMYLEAIVGP